MRSRYGQLILVCRYGSVPVAAAQEMTVGLVADISDMAVTGHG